MEKTSAAQLCQNLGTEFIELRTSSGDQSFWVHKKLLLAASSVIKDYFEGRGARCPSTPAELGFLINHPKGSVTFYFDELEITMLVGWLYSKNFGRGPNEPKWTIIELAGLTDLAGCIQCHDLLDDITDTLQDYYNDEDNVVQASDFETFFKCWNFHHKSSVGRFMIALLFWHNYLTGDIEDAEVGSLLSIDHNVMIDLGMLVKQVKEEGRFENPAHRGSGYFGLCYFHTHEKGKFCNSEPNHVEDSE